tara:strand:- start:2036 stop:2488 length:453 start_codon:yes stop_codon:yes gene_type:complete
MLHLKKRSLLPLLIIVAVFFPKLSFSKEYTTLTILTAQNKANFLVEIAKNSKERKKGLMNRTTLHREAGMLFVFSKERNISIWMKNTYFPLDIIFISKNKIIKKIIESAKPLEEKIYSSDSPARYALEVNAGVVREFNIEIGNKVYFEKY